MTATPSESLPLPWRQHCVWCGRWMAEEARKKMTCSHNCQQKRWRTIAMLEGTHGWVGHRFKRLEKTG